MLSGQQERMMTMRARMMQTSWVTVRITPHLAALGHGLHWNMRDNWQHLTFDMYVPTLKANWHLAVCKASAAAAYFYVSYVISRMFVLYDIIHFLEGFSTHPLCFMYAPNFVNARYGQALCGMHWSTGLAWADACMYRGLCTLPFINAYCSVTLLQFLLIYCWGCETR